MKRAFLSCDVSRTLGLWSLDNLTTGNYGGEGQSVLVDDPASTPVLLFFSSVSLNIQNMRKWSLSRIVYESFAQKGTSGLVLAHLVEKVNSQRCLPEPAAVLVVDAEHRRTHTQSRNARKAHKVETVRKNSSSARTKAGVAATEVIKMSLESRSGRKGLHNLTHHLCGSTAPAGCVGEGSSLYSLLQGQPLSSAHN